MARKFLYFIAICVVLIISMLLALRFWAKDLTEMAFVPTTQFNPQPALDPGAYANAAQWISRPGIGSKDPAQWLPEGKKPAKQKLPVAVFFVHPTSYLEKEHWNAPLDDTASRDRAELFVRAMASPFNASAELWVPRYRQAAFGTFLSDAPDAARALDLAYGDVLEAFDFFVQSVGEDTPIVLAGHSQGAFLLRRLMQDRVAGKPLAKRIAAAYLVGWPVSLEHDLPAMGLPACTAPNQPGCVISWLTFAEPADTASVLEGYARRPGLDRKPLTGSPFLCSNPLTGQAGGAADARANLGSLLPADDLKSGSLIAATVPARCGNDGFLYIGDPPDLGPYVLPGNNYHVYDIPLFWENLRADVATRVKAWQAKP